MGFLKDKKRANVVSTEETAQTLHKNLEFTASEQYRMLRTNVMFTLPADVKCPVIGVTSSTRGEGKSTTAINLSYVLAEKGSKVLLIDGDLRIPSVAKKLGLEASVGLSDVLVGAKIDVENLKSTINDHLYILSSGEIPPNPSELLGSARMERRLNAFKEHFDYIIIDLPPVNLVTDAISIASFLSGMIVVVREDYVTKTDLDQCFRQMKLANVKILGYVMNGSDTGTKKYGKYGRYKNYKYKKYYRYQSYTSHAADPTPKE